MYDGASFGNIRYEQVGPYVYDEHVSREDATFLNGDSILRYREQRSYKFNQTSTGRERSKWDKLSLVNFLWTNKKEDLLKIDETSELYDDYNTFVHTDTVQNWAFDGSEFMENGRSILVSKSEITTLSA